MIIKKQTKIKKKTAMNDKKRRRMFVNIMKRYPLNVLKMSQQFYLITKQKLNKNEIIS
jgi:hypothetical protein